MTARHRHEAETHYRTLRRRQRASTLRLVVLVVGITAASIWWLWMNVGTGI
jgi:hypothetical protein